MLKNKTLDAINIICMLIIAVLMVYSAVYVSHANSNMTVYHMGENAPCKVEIERTKHWGEASHGYKFGMEYDGLINNQSSSSIRDWTIVITVPENCHIDSSWNGDFSYEGKTITITSVDYNNTILSRDKETFGFILYSNTLDNIEDLTCSFYYDNVSLMDVPGFIIAICIFAIIFVVDVTSVFYERKTNVMEKQRNRYRRIVNESFVTFVSMIDAKDPYTRGHSLRVAMYSRELAKRMKLSEEAVKDIFYVALLHDIGKVGIADSILKKQGILTDEEREEIRNHVKYGGEILKGYSAIEDVYEGARYHHEWYNGKGYLEGLAGDEIPVFARIIGIADAFDAMSSSRCYRPKMKIEEIKAELIRCSGTQFDPDIVPIMIKMIEDGVAPVDATPESTDLQSLLEENGR